MASGRTAAAGGVILEAVNNIDGASCAFGVLNGFSLGFTGSISGSTTAQFDTAIAEKFNSTGSQTPSVSQTVTGGQWLASAIALKK